MEFNLFKNLRKKDAEKKRVEEYFKMIDGYSPAFTSFEGGIYEQALTRSAIHTFATHCSKLKPEVLGSGNNTLRKHLQFKPNPFMNTQQYLYKLATIYETENTVFVLPVVDADGAVTGYYPTKAQFCRVLEDKGRYFYQFTFSSGTRTFPIEEVGVLNKYLYKSDFFGTDNSALIPTLELLEANAAAAKEGMKNSAGVRFLAKMASVIKEKDSAKARTELRKENLNIENNGGIFLYDQKVESVTPIKSEPFIINAAQQKLIEDNVYNYFGVTRDILQNNFESDDWAAYYEGKIEPFALQASLTHTNMTFTENALSYGNEIMFTANRLQYLSPEQQRDIFQTLFDRGVMSGNEGAEMFNLPSLGIDGDKHFIRKEYIDLTEISEVQNDNEENQ